MAETTVLYPKGTEFNMEYYMSKHMPLVGKHLTPKGLKGWKVLDFGPEADFCVQATLEWEVRLVEAPGTLRRQLLTSWLSFLCRATTLSRPRPSRRRWGRSWMM